MEAFNIVVGVFSILGSISAIVTMGVSISIKNHISNNGTNNKAKNVNQKNKGKGNINYNS